MRIGLKTGGQQRLRITDCGWGPLPACPETDVLVERTGAGLAICFRVYEANPRITFHAMNEPVYRDSCVEFFVQPLGVPGSPYINFEMNAAGTLLLARGATRGERESLGAGDLEGVLIEPHGLSESEGRTCWALSLFVPFAWLADMVPGFRAQAGAVLRANFYKCGDDTAVPHYGSWNPMTAPRPDFHRPEDFGEIELLTDL